MPDAGRQLLTRRGTTARRPAALGLPGPDGSPPGPASRCAAASGGHAVRRVLAAALIVACLSAIPGCEWRGLNSLTPAGNRRRRRRFLHDPGAAARRRGHPAEHPGAGRRRQRRQRHQDRGAGLARAGDHAHQRRCPSARQQHRQGRADQPARLDAHRTGAAHRRAAARANSRTAR